MRVPVLFSERLVRLPMIPTIRSPVRLVAPRTMLKADPLVVVVLFVLVVGVVMVIVVVVGLTLHLLPRTAVNLPILAIPRPISLLVSPPMLVTAASPPNPAQPPTATSRPLT